MRKPFLRIPYTEILSQPTIVPASATTLPGAVTALQRFLLQDPHGSHGDGQKKKTLVLTGAGVSVASGLSDYRGPHGTYRTNRTYRPIYYPEFLASDAARRRYWARSFLGWPTLRGARPNAAHRAIAELMAMPGRRGTGGQGLGLVGALVTQNVDSFHLAAAREAGLVPGDGRGMIALGAAEGGEGVATTGMVELHGYLRAVVCMTCGRESDRDAFQAELARLNPAWAEFLARAMREGAFDRQTVVGTAHGEGVGPAEGERSPGTAIRTNPDGDVDVPGAPYCTFRYPPCPSCLAGLPPLSHGPHRQHRSHYHGATPVTPARVEVDADGAWLPGSGGVGVLKPAVVMFGESIAEPVRAAADAAVDGSARVLVLGTSLATYSAFRLVRRARDRGLPVAIVALGGVRGEEEFFNDSGSGVRVEMRTEELLPALVEALKRDCGLISPSHQSSAGDGVSAGVGGSTAFKDLLS